MTVAIDDNLWVPQPPLDASEAVNLWRKGVENLLSGQLTAIQTLLAPPTSATWPGFQSNYYRLTTGPKTVRAPYGTAPAWCTEGTATPSLVWVDNTNDRLVIFERLYDRWRAKAAGSTYFGGHSEITITDPHSVVYVPQGTGTHRGKYWVSSTASDTITTVDPHASFATSTFSLGAAESNVHRLFYDSDNDKVWAITANGTRICQIDPGDGSNDAQSTGWTNLKCLAPADTKIWLTKTSGLVTERIQYLDPSTLAATNPGITVSAGGCAGIKYLSDLAKVFVHDGNGDQTMRVIDNATATQDATLALGVNIDGDDPKAWIAELRSVVVGGNVWWYSIDILTGAMTSMGPAAVLGSGNQLNSVSYIEDYKEVIGITSGPDCICWPTPAYVARIETL